jgi:hypothetical protein
MGSAIGLCGSLVARNADSLVTSLAARAVRLSDNAEHVVDGLFSRARTLSSTAGDVVELQSRQVIDLPVDKPRPYDVIFCNDRDRLFFKQLGDDIQAAWNWRMIDQIEPSHDLSIPDNAKPIARRNQLIFTEPLNSSFVEEMTATLLTKFFWRAGAYRISLEVGVGAETFSKRWQITISTSDEGKLSLNALRMVATQVAQNSNDLHISGSALSHVSLVAGLYARELTAYVCSTPRLQVAGRNTFSHKALPLTAVIL